MRSLAFVASVLLSGSALAQSPMVKRFESPDTRRVAAAYGDCFVKQSAGIAQVYILHHLRLRRTVSADRVLTDKLSNGPCLLRASKTYNSVRMRFPADTMRYTLADALFRRSLATRPPLADLSGIAPLEHATIDESEYQPKPGKRFNAQQAEEAQIARARDAAFLTASQLGECVVRADPSAAFALLKTEVATPAESAALGPVAEAAGQCVAQGSALELNKSMLRGTVAMNYYRLAFAPRAAAASAVRK